MRHALPSPRDPWDRRKSLAIDRAIVAFEMSLGFVDGRYPDPCGVFRQLYTLALRNDGERKERR